MPKTNSVIFFDAPLMIHQGHAARRVCSCATQDYKNKVIRFNENCSCDKGWNHLQNKSGFYTGGLYKISYTCINFLKNDYEVVLVFDVPKDKLKNTALLDSYKGNRGEKSDAISEQMAYAMKFFPMFPKIDCYIGIEDEGDDVMATLALEYKEKGYKDIVIATDDKDLFPMLAHGIKLFRQGSFFDTMDFVEKFGFTPDRFDEYLSIIGDSADAYNLIKGLGPVAATYIIENHSHVCDIFKDEHWEKLPSKYKKKLVKICDKTNKEIKLIDELELSYKLAQLNLKAPYKQIKNEVSLAEIHEQLQWLEFQQMKNNLNLFMENTY